MARQSEWSVLPFKMGDRTLLDVADVRNSLRAVMWRNVGIVRMGPRLTETREIISFWCRYVMDKEFGDPQGWELQNMLTVARLVAMSARQREETRGVHCRTDFPETSPAWQRHIITSITGEEWL